MAITTAEENCKDLIIISKLDKFSKGFTILLYLLLSISVKWLLAN